MNDREAQWIGACVGQQTPSNKTCWLRVTRDGYIDSLSKLPSNATCFNMIFKGSNVVFLDFWSYGLPSSSSLTTFNCDILPSNFTISLCQDSLGSKLLLVLYRLRRQFRIKRARSNQKVIKKIIVNNIWMRGERYKVEK